MKSLKTKSGTKEQLSTGNGIKEAAMLDIVKMTPKEFNILHLLMKNPGRVFSAEERYERVWTEDAISTETIMVHVRNIREKIEIDSKNPKYLKVVWGVGYKIEKIIDGETIAEVLEYVQYNPKRLVRIVETWVTSAVKSGAITIDEGKEFLSNYRSGLYGYTYLEQ